MDDHYNGVQINRSTFDLLTFGAAKHLIVCISCCLGGRVGLVKHNTFAPKLGVADLSPLTPCKKSVQIK